MKHKNHCRRFMAVGAACLLMLAALSASAQVTPGYSGAFTNLPLTVPTATLTITTNTLLLRQNSGLALSENLSSSSGTTASGCYVWASADGTNYPAAPFAFVSGTVSTAPATILTNWSAAQLSGFYSLKIQLTNATAGTLTNGGVIWRQWAAPLAY